MNPIARTFNAIGGRLLATVGRAGHLTTTGRRSGLPRIVAVGFVRRPDGTILIGSGRPDAAWVVNLRADPRCRFRTRGGEAMYRAMEQTGDARGPALAELRRGMGGAGSRFTFHDVFVLEPEPTPR
jgi:deazaflavin-dependent oxidoreductase (nitroreductase family)